jgi:phage-related protein
LPSPDTSAFEESINSTVEYFRKKLAPIKEFFTRIWTEITEFFISRVRRIRNFWWENGDQIIQAMKNVAGFLAPIIGGIVKFIWESIKGLIGGIIRFFTGLLKFFAGVFTGDWQKAWEGLKEMVVGAFQAIWNFFNLTFIGGIRKALVEIVAKGAKAFFNFAKNFQDEFWKAIGKVTSNVKGFVTGLITMFRDMGKWWTDHAVNVAVAVVNAFSKIGAVGNTIWNAIKTAFSGTVRWFLTNIINPVIESFGSIKSAFRTGIEGGLRAVINNVRTPINDMIDTMNNVKNNIPLANKLPNIPRIPRLAQGGIATGATLAMVGEGSQDEAIAPLDKLQGFITNAVLTAMRAQGTGGGGTGGDIVLNIDGRQFARIVKPHLDKEVQRIGSNVRLNPI